MRRRIGRWTTVLGLVLGMAGCHGPAIWRYEEQVEAAPPPAVHGVHETRLAALMRDLDRLRDARLPQAIDPREEETRQADEIAEVARALADSAAHIPDAMPEGLDPTEREAFRGLAEALRQASLRLADEAPALAYADLRTRLAEIDATCDQCHSRFRVPEIVDGER